MEHIQNIVLFIWESFIHIWPYLVLTIPIAVFIQLSGFSKKIHKAFTKHPIVSILLATAIGAISPFCSCGVIPVISALLISGVPLAPVMAFWIASPSMDPEIFFLSVASIGWDLSIWRLVGTFGISLLAGFITHWLSIRNYLSEPIIREAKQIRRPSRDIQLSLLASSADQGQNTIPMESRLKPIEAKACCSGSPAPEAIDCSCPPASPLWRRILSESWKAFALVAKFMALAFLINALIFLYLPDNLMASFIQFEGPFAVVGASLLGVPFYTSNIAALPIVSGLLSLRLNQGAALAFLIAGPTTTLPAMSAVWGLVNKKVFALYLGFAFFGAILLGSLYNFVH